MEPITEHENDVIEVGQPAQEFPPIHNVADIHSQQKSHCLPAAPLASDNRHCSVTEGLNSLLLLTPVEQLRSDGEKWRERGIIRRSILRDYYGRSVHSPNLSCMPLGQNSQLTGTGTCTCTCIYCTCSYTYYYTCTLYIYMYIRTYIHTCTCMYKCTCKACYMYILS